VMAVGVLRANNGYHASTSAPSRDAWSTKSRADCAASEPLWRSNGSTSTKPSGATALSTLARPGAEMSDLNTEPAGRAALSRFWSALLISPQNHASTLRSEASAIPTDPG
jgi:hypothetical protein